MAFTGPQKGCHSEMETAMADFIWMQSAAAFSVRTEMLQAKVRKLLKKRSVLPADFCRNLWSSSASVTVFTPKSPKSYQLTTKISCWSSSISCFERKKVGAYPLRQIGNMDQTPVCFDMPVAYTISEKGGQGSKDVLCRVWETARDCDAVLHSRPAQAPSYIVCKSERLLTKDAFPQNVI